MRAFSVIPEPMFSFWKKKPLPAAENVPVQPAPADEAAIDPATHAPVPAEPVPAASHASTDSPAHSPVAAHVGVHDAIGAQVEAFGGSQTYSNAEQTAVASAAPGKAGWRERLGNSLFSRSLGTLFVRHPKLDDDLLDAIETCLLSADVGVSATTLLVEGLRGRMHRRDFADAAQLLRQLRADLLGLVETVGQPLNVDAGPRPFVILTVGVNGVGKTTTIGKLAKRYVEERKNVLLAAGDTFRAAAVEQLKTWGDRNGVAVLAQGSGADSASVIFDAFQAARARNAHLLIADTAGRLHTQSGLMDELTKIKRVLGKLDPGAPHEVLLVIDGTTGQNAINQVRQFNAAVGVTGLVVTKLDGTAKGGVIFALAREFGIPIRYVGLGESVHDLRAFDPYAFVDALLPESLSA